MAKTNAFKVPEDLSALTAETIDGGGFDLAAWGLNTVAYIKKSSENNEIIWSIHAAEGTRVGEAPDRGVAEVLVRQHDLRPVNVH